MTARVLLERDGDVAVVVIDNPPINAGSAKVRRKLLEAIDSVARDDGIVAAVLIGAGTTFIAGSDIREFGQPLAEPQLPAVIGAIEACSKPFVAALHGAALGGGFELALGCDARVAAAGTLVGLPEVTLGIIPGAGGTQRLPRLVGVPRAIQMVCSGERVSSAAALAAGLIDEEVNDDLRRAAVSRARTLVGTKNRLRDRTVPLASEAEVAAAGAAALKAGKNRPAVQAAIEAVTASSRLPIDDALADERAVFQQLRVSREAAALRHQFFAERESAKHPALESLTPRKVDHIAVIGAGTMGSGIAIAALDAGYEVLLLEQDGAALERGANRIHEHYASRVRSGKMKTSVAADREARLRSSLDWDALASADLVIEAVFEELEAKKQVFKRIDAVAKAGAILASNTSYLDLDEIASVTKRPQDVIGMHYFSPANIMKLLEVVRGAKTAKDVLATVMKIGKQTGKVPVVSGVGPGFIGNRMLRQRGLQAEALVLDGADPATIDKLMYDFGFPMGPFQMMDVVGMDVIKDLPGQLSIRGAMFNAGRLGQKGVGGFYNYDANRNQSPSPEAAEVVEGFRKAKGATARPVSDEEIMDRSLLLVINEGAKILEEGIAIRSSDIDTIWLNGYGWPVYRGGPMYYADQLGLKNVVAKLKQYQAKLGDEWKPAALLEKLAAEGKGFADFKR